MAQLSIVRPGMFTTIQDLGRWGFQSRGVPVSGAMDPYSHRLANRFVGNEDAAATLEATMMGPEIACDADLTFAVTGAVFDLTLDGIAITMNQAIEAKAGSILKFGERRRGARAYLAVAGGIEVPEVLGSRSTHVLTATGGLQGRALRAGDRIATKKKGTGVRACALFPAGRMPLITLRQSGSEFPPSQIEWAIDWRVPLSVPVPLAICCRMRFPPVRCKCLQQANP